VRGAPRRLCICALAAGAAAACLAGSNRSAEAATVGVCGKLLPPASGAYLGAALGDAPRDARMAAFERLAGQTLSLVSFAQPWYRGLAFPRSRVLEIWRHGAVPYLAFLPESGNVSGPRPRQRNPERRYTLQRIIDGDFDAPLRAWARGAGDLGVPLLVSFGAAVNDEDQPWNARWNGAGATEGYGDPDYPDGAERYRDAYRHLVTLVRSEGVSNVAFVFDAEATPPGPGWNGVALYYPGDTYVDWLGISAHGAREPAEPLTPFARQLDDSGVYTTLTTVSRRPVAIAELGTAAGAGADRAGWIRDAFAALRAGRYARVHAVTWRDAAGGSGDPIDPSADSRASFRAAVSGQFFAVRPRFSGDCRPPPPVSVTAKAHSKGRVVRVRWSPVLLASAYEVYRDGRLLGTTKGTTLEDTTAPPGRSHTYTVRAVSPGGRSV